jgi:hypothetical protein
MTMALRVLLILIIDSCLSLKTRRTVSSVDSIRRWAEVGDKDSLSRPIPAYPADVRVPRDAAIPGVRPEVRLGRREWPLRRIINHPRQLRNKLLLPPVIPGLTWSYLVYSCRMQLQDSVCRLHVLADADFLRQNSPAGLSAQR